MDPLAKYMEQRNEDTFKAIAIQGADRALRMTGKSSYRLVVAAMPKLSELDDLDAWKARRFSVAHYYIARRKPQPWEVGLKVLGLELTFQFIVAYDLKELEGKLEECAKTAYIAEVHVLCHGTKGGKVVGIGGSKVVPVRADWPVRTLMDILDKYSGGSPIGGFRTVKLLHCYNHIESTTPPEWRAFNTTVEPTTSAEAGEPWKASNWNIPLDKVGLGPAGSFGHTGLNPELWDDPLVCGFIEACWRKKHLHPLQELVDP